MRLGSKGGLSESAKVQIAGSGPLMHKINLFRLPLRGQKGCSGPQYTGIKAYTRLSTLEASALNKTRSVDLTHLEATLRVLQAFILVNDECYYVPLLRMCHRIAAAAGLMNIKIEDGISLIIVYEGLSHSHNLS